MNYLNGKVNMGLIAHNKLGGMKMEKSIKTELEKTIIALLERAQALSGANVNCLNEELSLVVQSANTLIVTYTDQERLV
jgi:hypothetical protein